MTVFITYSSEKLSGRNHLVYTPMQLQGNLPPNLGVVPPLLAAFLPDAKMLILTLGAKPCS